MRLGEVAAELMRRDREAPSGRSVQRDRLGSIRNTPGHVDRRMSAYADRIRKLALKVAHYL